ncbi:ABC transporter ATP-binding protein [Tepidamorphus sp. 3E244]|uniref:ABC transporter ATP-binding protein n=1 Tax=Tepidamorphus sp. 3E244 TaxID=3385498 RepID=UPI0038FD0958
MTPAATKERPPEPAGRAKARTRAGASIAAEVSFAGVCHAYGAVPSLRGVDLDIAPGEVICLLGPSGCGKSTLLRLTAGLDAVTAGAIRINRRDVSSTKLTVPPEKRGVGLMFQDYALFPHLTILKNVMFGLRELSRADGEREAMNALSRVGLDSYARQYPHALSGGEQQRVALARAIVPRPSVLLMDEPFSGLDKRLRDSVRDDTLSVMRETRATAMLVTHDPEEAMRMADRIVLMREGRIVQIGTALELYNQPNDIYAARFFSEVNELAGTIHDGMVDTPVGRFAAPGLEEGQRVTVCIRQQGIEPVGDAETIGTVPSVVGRVLARRFLGEVDILELALEGLDQTLTARARNVGDLAVGGDIRIRANPQDVLVFPA